MHGQSGSKGWAHIEFPDMGLIVTLMVSISPDEDTIIVRVEAAERLKSQAESESQQFPIEIMVKVRVTLHDRYLARPGSRWGFTCTLGSAPASKPAAAWLAQQHRVAARAVHLDDQRRLVRRQLRRERPGISRVCMGLRYRAPRMQTRFLAQAQRSYVCSNSAPAISQHRECQAVGRPHLMSTSEWCKMLQDSAPRQHPHLQFIVRPVPARDGGVQLIAAAQLRDGRAAALVAPAGVARAPGWLRRGHTGRRRRCA